MYSLRLCPPEHTLNTVARFLFHTRAAEDQPMDIMPNIVMQIIVKGEIEERDNPILGNWCLLRLHKSLCARVAFFILRTPVVLRRRINVGRITTRGGRISLTEESTNARVRPSIFPIFIVSQILLYPGAGLHARCPDNLRHLTFQLTISRTVIRGIQGQEFWEEDLINTAIGLLELRALQTRNLPSTQGGTDSSDSRLVRGPLDSATDNPDWHVMLITSKLGVEGFIDAVS
jgi:hypothetical protein